jgi:hypothetical protein
MSEQLQKWIERVVLFRVRVRHRRRSRAKHKARITAIGTVRHTLDGSKRMNAASIATVFNVGLYVLLLDQDIAYFTDDLVCAIGDRRRAFLAKQEAVLLYEAGEDLPQLLGRDFRDAVKALRVSPEQLSNLNQVSSELKRFWQDHREFLHPIRNALAAHRDHDALQYAAALETLKPFEVMARAAELSQLLERLIRVITEFALSNLGPAAILHDMAVSKKRP